MGLCRWDRHPSILNKFVKILLFVTAFVNLSIHLTTKENKMLRILLFISLFMLVSCSNDTTVEQPNNMITSPNTLNQEVVVSGLNNAWGLVFLNNSEALVTQRNGQIWWVDVETGEKQHLYTVTNAILFGQGGLLGITKSPQFNTDNQIFVTYTKQGSNGYTVALGRFEVENKVVSNFQEIYVANAWSNSGAHFGSRIAFDAEGYLYFSIGDRGVMEEAQNTQNDIGCVLRLNPDGSIPNNNPFINNSNYSPAIFSYGSRNIQGMAFNSFTNQIWSHEHGPQGGDEINMMASGNNYEWPLATFGQQYGGGNISALTSIPGGTNPVHHFTPSIAPSGMTIIEGNKYPGWQGHVLFGALAAQHLNRTIIKNGIFIEEVRYFEGQGRIREVVLSPDGFIYMINESTQEILKVLPVFD